ncbi:hypothetical protein Drorol1_Dr00024644 [Drosera rotundifolia]
MRIQRGASLCWLLEFEADADGRWVSRGGLGKLRCTVADKVAGYFARAGVEAAAVLVGVLIGVVVRFRRLGSARGGHFAGCPVTSLVTKLLDGLEI